jgi:hypothetical protein
MISCSRLAFYGRQTRATRQAFRCAKTTLGIGRNLQPMASRESFRTELSNPTQETGRCCAAARQRTGMQPSSERAFGKD